MTKLMRVLTLSGVVLGFTAAVAIADDLEAVQKKIHAAWEKQKSMTGKMLMVTRMELGGMVVDGKGDGTVEFLRDGDKVKTRTDMKSTMTRKMGEQETKMEQSMLYVSDGEFGYTLTEMMGQKSAAKTKIDPRMTGEPKGMFEELAKDYTLKLLPDETLDGMKTYVIEATPKEKAAAGPATRMVLGFHQDTGFVLKMTMFGADEKPITTMTYSDLKFDTKINPDDFKFKAPEGVTVVDETVEKAPMAAASQAVKPEVKPEAKPEAKPEVKPAPKPE